MAFSLFFFSSFSIVQLGQVFLYIKLEITQRSHDATRNTRPAMWLLLVAMGPPESKPNEEASNGVVTL